MISSSNSRLQDIWDRHEKQWRRLDELEEHIDESVMRKRRRLANLLDETSTHRQSHLRLFVTHLHSPPKKWTLVIEGRLLVGHLDHKSAAKVEQEAAEAAGVVMTEDAASAVGGSTDSGVASSGLPHQSAASSLQQQHVMIRSTDRTQYRGISEKEGDIPVEPTRFTHFFDKMTVSFQTTYMPTEGTTPAKKSRSKSKRSKQSEEAAELQRRQRLLTSSPTTVVEWKRQDSPDAHAFHAEYNEEPQVADKNTHSVVATIHLYPCPGPEDRYQPSQKLAAALFPQHALEPIKSRRRKASATPSKKRRIDAGEDEEKEIPTQNHIHVPPSLSMKEIVSAIFLYVQDKKLADDSDKSIIVNDKLLSNLFDCDRMSYFELQQRLLSQELVTKIVEDPIVLTYIMTPETATQPSQQPPSQEEEDTASMLSFDTNIFVPGLLHFRVRELMRRIKRREFEYTSSRTKARNLLMACRGASESVVKTRIEEAVCGRGVTSSDFLPVWLALAKAAPPGSEARAAAHIDARTCVLMDRLQHHCRAAKAAWDVVDACRGHQAQQSTSDCNEGNE